MFKKIDNAIQIMSDWLAKTAQFALFLTMLIIVANVLIRIKFKPLPGTYEIVEILGALLLSLGVAYCAVKRGHVSVDVLVEQCPKWLQITIDSLMNLIATVFVSAIGWEAIRQSIRVMNRGLITAHLQIPIYPFYFLVSIGIILLALVLLARFIGILFSEGVIKKIKLGAVYISQSFRSLFGTVEDGDN